MFKISFWDEFSGDPAADLGIVAETEDAAKAAAQRVNDEMRDGAGEAREALEWDGPMAECLYDAGFATAHDLKYRYWVHAA